MNYDRAVVGKEQSKRIGQLERIIEQREKEREQLRLCSASMTLSSVFDRVAVNELGRQHR